MISIRRERPEDIAVIRTVNETGFDQSTEADIIDALRDVCPDVLSLVAESDGEIVGHILFSPVTIEDGSQSRQGMGLAPVAVTPDRQRQGIGSELVQAGLEILRKQGCPFVIVLGHPAFTRASASFPLPVTGSPASGKAYPTRRSWCLYSMRPRWPE